MSAENASNAAAPDTVVLVHGFWVTPLSWEKWVERYEGKGYRVLTPIYRASRAGWRRLGRTPRQSKR
jgi:alpha-beta hydrolase superfamily lysophospholipase